MGSSAQVSPAPEANASIIEASAHRCPVCRTSSKRDESETPAASARFFKSQSLVELGKRAIQTTTWTQDLENLIRWELCLLPSSILIVAMNILMAFTLQQLRDMWPFDARLLFYTIGYLCFSLTSITMYRNFEVGWLPIFWIIFSKIVCFISFIGIAISQGFPWSSHWNFLYLAITFAAASGCNLFVAQILAGEPDSTFNRLLKATFMASSSWTSILLILEYSFISSNLDSSVLEWLVTGLIYPLISLLVGRLLIADVLSFMVLSVFTHGSTTDLLSFYSILVKTCFYFSGQISILRVKSSSSFYIAITISSITELFGTYINIIMMRHFQRNSTKYKERFGESTLIGQWCTVRSEFSNQRLIMHMIDEAIGEKLIIFAACLVLLVNKELAENLTINSLLLRGVVLLFAEFCQDFLQRRLLNCVASLSATARQPRVLSFMQNLSNTCVIFMAQNLWRTALNS